MKHIELKNITKTYPNGFNAIDNLSLGIDQKEFLVIVGPSGCGKTTLLKLIAGLEPISSGELLINNNCMNDVASNQRNTAMVFQNYPLFNHMTIYENILFGVKLKKYNTDEIKQEIYDLSSKLSIQDLLNHYPNQLSGGQKQRVALARSLISKPEILLMDEPLSSLDKSLKYQLRQLIKELHQSLDTTFIYVTHDQNEAMALATRIVVLKDGIIMQDGTPEDIYHHPKNLFVATFISQHPINLFECEINNNEINLNNMTIQLNKELDATNVILGIKPEDIEIVDLAHCKLQGMIHHIEMIGSDYIVHTTINNEHCLIRTSLKPTTQQIGMVIKRYYIFDKTTNMTI